MHRCTRIAAETTTPVTPFRNSTVFPLLFAYNADSTCLPHNTIEYTDFVIVPRLLRLHRQVRRKHNSFDNKPKRRFVWTMAENRYVFLVVLAILEAKTALPSAVTLFVVSKQNFYGLFLFVNVCLFKSIEKKFEPIYLLNYLVSMSSFVLFMTFRLEFLEHTSEDLVHLKSNLYLVHHSENRYYYYLFIYFK